MGLFNNGTSQQHGGPPQGPEQAETFMKPVSLSQSFLVRAGDCWVVFADSYDSTTFRDEPAERPEMLSGSSAIYIWAEKKFPLKAALLSL